MPQIEELKDLIFDAMDERNVLIANPFACEAVQAAVTTLRSFLTIASKAMNLLDEYEIMKVQAKEDKKLSKEDKSLMSNLQAIYLPRKLFDRCVPYLCKLYHIFANGLTIP